MSFAPGEELNRVGIESDRVNPHLVIHGFCREGAFQNEGFGDAGIILVLAENQAGREKKVAEAVGDSLALVRFDPVDYMGVGPDDQVDIQLQKAGGMLPEKQGRCLSVFDTPMGKAQELARLGMRSRHS